MWNGIKPTRLWHKTGMIHMRNMLSARYSARLEADLPRVYNMRNREDLFRLYGIIMGSAAFTAYLFGTFSKPNDCKTELEYDDDMTCPSDPCPPIQPPPSPKKCPKRKPKE